jgi:hypothetical protein
LRFEIEQRFFELDKLIAVAGNKSVDEETAAYLCKLGCVLVCGTIERCVEHLVVERVGGRAQPRIASFLKTHFKRGTNYDCEAIQQLMFRFDSEWGHDFKAFVESNDRVKEGVASCYAIRNSVAHGGGQSVGPKALKDYYDASLTLVAELEKILRQ